MCNIAVAAVWDARLLYWLTCIDTFADLTLLLIRHLADFGEPVEAADGNICFVPAFPLQNGMGTAHG